MSRSPFRRRRTRRTRMRGGDPPLWKKKWRSMRTKPEIVEKYMGYLSKNTTRAAEYLKQFPWLETGPPGRVYMNDASYYEKNSAEEEKIKDCTREKMKLLINENREGLNLIEKFFDYCYENPNRCYYIIPKNFVGEFGHWINLYRNDCRREIGTHTEKYLEDLRKAWEAMAARRTNEGPRDGETRRSTIPYEYPNSNKE